QMKLKPVDSALLSAVYALNPFMINLSLSFMTDVPAVALTNWALFASIVALKKKRFTYWLISVLCLTASMATRQSALILLPPIYLAGLITLKDNKDRALLLSTLLIPFFTYTYLQDWLLQASMIPSGYTSFSGMAQNSILTLLCSPWKIIVSVAQGLCYVGLALMPVTLALAVCGLRSKNARLYTGIAAVLAVLFVAAPLASQQIQGAFMPYSLNLFMPPILGSYCLVGGVPFWRAEHLKIFTYVADIAAVATAFCVVMSVLKPAELLADMQKSDELCRRIFLAVLVACVTGGLLVQLSVSNFDRYYMVALAPLLVCLAPLWRDLNPLKLRAITVALVVAIGAYGTIATMDVMNFTRAQWQAIRQLEAQKIPAKRIDGGPIYDIYAGGLPLTQGFKQGQGWPDSMRGTPETCKLRWWPLVKDDYIIAADTVNGYHATSKLKYWSPIFWRYRTIYTLKSDKLN
ncbi:MAG: glucosyltransferase domain-containing protein, partial [Candidatus Obscuribacterales bacterium]|nr:glucosyltransferase domain-containing protein [Candidatus Obscuribacterales bacterium]